MTFSMTVRPLFSNSNASQIEIGSALTNCQVELSSQTDLLTIGKAKIINRAIQDIGMGRYQWGLFVLCGFGWIADK